MNVIVKGSAVNYQVSGKGPVVVLLHGWGDNIATFKELTKSLQLKYTVIALDLLGFGGSEVPKEVFDLEKYAQFVSNFLYKIDMKHVYAFVGHSNGGAIAIRGLSSGILKSDKLVLLASSGVRSSYTGRKKIFRLAAKTAKYPTMLLPKSTQAKLKKRVYKAIGSDMFVSEHLQETFKQVVREDVVHDSAMIQQPTLLIYGSIDKSTPLNYGEKFNKQIENSKLEIIDGADHFLHHTHGQKVNKLVIGFLEN